MEFVWNDGGRAAAGFVGTTGDCVTRSIAIATGLAYREVYNALGEAAAKSPRRGIPVDIASGYLSERKWEPTAAYRVPFNPHSLPRGVVIAHISDEDDRSHHMCTLIDQVVHDTWDASTDDDYIVHRYWTNANLASNSSLPSPGSKQKVSKQQEVTQKEFDRIMRWLRALDKTASDGGSTEAEKRNALRMMQELMLSNNLTRDDIADDDSVDHMQFTRMNCYVNGRRACGWEKSLAHYVCNQVFPMVQWYVATRGHRTLFQFYGPHSDVKNCIALFREILLTIAAAAKLQYGGYSRGSGASYAEGYVHGLPGSETTDAAAPSVGKEAGSCNTELIQARTLAIHNAARDWLRIECNVRLTSASRSGRSRFDPAAANRGQQHGAKHQIHSPTAPKRIEHQ